MGDQVVLFSDSDGVIEGTMNSTKIEGKMGIIFYYDYVVSQDANGVVTASVADLPRINPQVKSITEGTAARLAFVNQGQEYLADRGIGLATARSATENGIGIFAGASGGKSRYDTGSHVDVAGVNYILGVASSNSFDQNRLTLGLAGEFGFGSYESHTPTENLGAVKAEGDVSYVGAALLARYEIQASSGTLYLEGSGRVGNSKADFTIRNVMAAGSHPHYDISGTYVGAHAGIGYDAHLTEQADLDLYFKYLWSMQNGKEVKISRTKVKMEDAYSSRIRAGARFNYDVNGFVKPYVGGAYMREFMGDTDARAFGINLPNAELKGNSAMGELGVVLISSDGMPISLDAGLQGFFGTRRGMSGSLEVKYEF
jgi:outer membrane autotransporter protein